MATVKAIWTGYLGRASDGTILVPGAEVDVDPDVAAANPHYSVTAQTSTQGSAPPEQPAQATAIAAAPAEAAAQTGAA